MFKVILVFIFLFVNVKCEIDFFVFIVKVYGFDVFFLEVNDGVEGGLLGEYNEII